MQRPSLSFPFVPLPLRLRLTSLAPYTCAMCPAISVWIPVFSHYATPPFACPLSASCVVLHYLILSLPSPSSSLPPALYIVLFLQSEAVWLTVSVCLPANGDPDRPPSAFHFTRVGASLSLPLRALCPTIAVPRAPHQRAQRR